MNFTDSFSKPVLETVNKRLFEVVVLVNLFFNLKEREGERSSLPVKFYSKVN